MRRASGLAVVLLLLAVSPLLGSGEVAQTIHAGRILDVSEGVLRSDVLIRIANGVIVEFEGARTSGGNLEGEIMTTRDLVTHFDGEESAPWRVSASLDVAVMSK